MLVQVWDRKDHEKVLSLLSTFIISASESTCVAIAETCGSLTVDLLQRLVYDNFDSKTNVVIGFC